MKKIILLRFSSLGDIVLTTSVINTLRELSYEIYYVTKSQYRELLHGVLPAGNLLTLSKDDSLATLRGKISAIDSDLVLDLHSSLRSRMLTVGLRNVFRVEKRRKERREALGRGTHCSDYSVIFSYRELLERALGITEIKMAYPRLARNNSSTVSRRVILHPGARWKLKMWPCEHFKSLYDLFEMGGFSPVFIEDSPRDFMGKRSYRTDSIRELMELISTAELFIGNDSGPGHIAAALGVPSITLFGPTHPCLGFTPQGDRAEYITLEYDCAPCTLHGKGKCKLTGSPVAKCLFDLSPEKVYEFASKRMFV